MEVGTVERTLGPRVQEMLDQLLARFEQRRAALLPQREKRRAQLAAGEVAFLEETAHVRRTVWQVDPLPTTLMERNVELIGGCTRSELINGLNAGANSYIADLWNFTCGDPWSIMRAHRVLARAARLELAYLDPDWGRVRANPRSATRLIIAPRPLHVLESSVLLGDEPSPAAFFDMAMLGVHALQPLTDRQGGMHLLLRDVQSHQEARLWAAILDEMEQLAGLERGRIRATIMVDSLAGALQADEVLFELMHHASGLSIDPQGFAADHIALFNGMDASVFPDREAIGLNAPFLHALERHIIGISHRRGCLAIGSPSFTLPPLDPLKIKPAYQEMLADKEREAGIGFDGTMVVHADTVNEAMNAFNKHRPRANTAEAVNGSTIQPHDMIAPPEGAITVEGLIATIRTALRALVLRWQGNAHVVQGSRLHDRSSLRLAIRMVWHWRRSRRGVITATQLDISGDLLRFLIRKESEKMFGESDARTRSLAKQAVELTLDLVLAESIPLEPQS